MPDLIHGAVKELKLAATSGFLLLFKKESWMKSSNTQKNKFTVIYLNKIMANLHKQNLFILDLPVWQFSKKVII